VSVATIFLQSSNFINACYIVAFSLFIYGMSGLTGPRTAVRGNMIAAAIPARASADFHVGGVFSLRSRAV